MDIYEGSKSDYNISKEGLGNDGKRKGEEIS